MSAQEGAQSRYLGDLLLRGLQRGRQGGDSIAGIESSKGPEQLAALVGGQNVERSTTA